MKNYFMVRNMYCEYCAMRNGPQVGDMYVFFKRNGDIIALQQFSSPEQRGYVSHLLQYSDPLKFEKGLVKVEITCSVNGCGLDANPYNLFSEGIDSCPIKILRVEPIYLPYERFKEMRRQSVSFSEFSVA